ncbi:MULTISPECIES: hypothetical protein [Exiguobacterium]|uniref:hypothetical protein n=1 Tax=Exiguobacterium TaxID=33986 RepID=UPI001BE8DD19|nr:MULTISPECIES: hypothetical protein [Exiguobacterium]MCT4793000.1 hypothetical protein [Exiguobacterium artemiae]
MKRYAFSLLLLLSLLATVLIIYQLEFDLNSSPLPFILLPILLLMTWMNGRINFLILVTYTLGLGFVYLVLSWYNAATNEQQLFYIAQHLLSSFGVFLYWLFLRQLRSIFENNKELQERVKLLEGFSESPQLLSYSEFLDRTDFLIAGAKRREEKNILFHIQIPATKFNKKSIMQQLTNAGLKVFRAHFDVMSQRNRQEFIIFLQNTDSTGANIAWSRYEKELRNRFTTVDFPFEFSQLHVNSSVEETLDQQERVDK